MFPTYDDWYKSLPDCPPKWEGWRGVWPLLLAEGLLIALILVLAWLL